MITFTIDFTGTPDSSDVLAARHIIHQENLRRAALTPPGTPLLFANAAQTKASYLSVLVALITNAHASYVQQAQSVQGIEIRFTAEQLAEIRTNLVTRLNAGETAANLVADTAA